MNVITTLSNLIAEVSLRTLWHTTRCMRQAPSLCQRDLHLHHLSACVEDNWRRSERLYMISHCAFLYQHHFLSFFFGLPCEKPESTLQGLKPDQHCTVREIRENALQTCQYAKKYPNKLPLCQTLATANVVCARILKHIQQLDPLNTSFFGVFQYHICFQVLRYQVNSLKVVE